MNVSDIFPEVCDNKVGNVNGRERERETRNKILQLKIAINNYIFFFFFLQEQPSLRVDKNYKILLLRETKNVFTRRWKYIHDVKINSRFVTSLRNTPAIRIYRTRSAVAGL